MAVFTSKISKENFNKLNEIIDRIDNFKIENKLYEMYTNYNFIKYLNGRYGCRYGYNKSFNPFSEHCFIKTSQHRLGVWFAVDIDSTKKHGFILHDETVKFLDKLAEDLKIEYKFVNENLLFSKKHVNYIRFLI